MYAAAPPAPPPKPGSHDTSRIGTPADLQSPRLLPVSDRSVADDSLRYRPAVQPEAASLSQPIDPGDRWLPAFLEDKSRQDLEDILADPKLLQALTFASATMEPSLRASQDALQTALDDAAALAAHVAAAEDRLGEQTATTQAQLLATHALDRQWRAKQSELDRALAAFAPASLYQRLAQGLQEQEAVCLALEESFLDARAHANTNSAALGAGGSGPSVGSPAGASGVLGIDASDGGPATEREAADWVRRYREAKKLYYLRQERKERWDEGRVGGWR